MKKRIFEFDDYRKFLKHFYETEKEENARFSLRQFSKLAGFKSHAVLWQVMGGTRNIASSSMSKFVKALKLNKEEAEFFKYLVLFNQAATSEEKREYATEILRCRGHKRFFSSLKAAQFNYFSHWYVVVVRELAGLAGFKEDEEWIARSLTPAISAREAKHALQTLLELRLISRDSGGRLLPTEAYLETADEVISSAFANCHKEFLKRASESIDSIPRLERDISGITFSMSDAAVKKIKEKIHLFRKEILDIAAQDDAHNKVYQLSLQLFPVAQIEKGNGVKK